MPRALSFGPPSQPLTSQVQPPTPTLTQVTQSQGTSTLTPTDAQAATAPLTTDRPRLSPPKTMSELRYLKTMETFRQFGTGMLGSISDRLEGFKTKLQEVTKENVEQLKEAAGRAKTAGFWSLLQKIATCLVSALSLIVGVSLIATGGGAILGAALIASGILSIANLALSETGTWDWVAKKLANEDENRRQQLAFILPIAVTVAAALLSIGGSIGAALNTGINLLDKGVFIAQAALGMFQGATTIGQGIADSRLLWKQADISETSAQMNVERHKIESTTKSIENILNELNSNQERAQQFMRLAVQSNQTVVQDLHS